MKIMLDDSDLKPLIEQVVSETIERLADERARLGSRLAYTEPEAAALVGVARHTLRDCRLRGEITGRLVGKKIVYSRDELLRFLREGSE